MPNATDKRRKKRAALICAAVFIGLLGLYLAVILFPLLTESVGALFAVGILVLYGLVILAMIAGILLALRQRLREIEGGEEDEAKQY